MPEIVRDPGGEQLAHGHRTEGGVRPRRSRSRRPVQLMSLARCRPQAREFFEQIGHGAPLRLPNCAKRSKDRTRGLSRLQDDPRALHPVRPLPWIRCPTTSNGLQVSGPSFSRIHHPAGRRAGSSRQTGPAQNPTASSMSYRILLLLGAGDAAKRNPEHRGIGRARPLRPARRVVRRSIRAGRGRASGWVTSRDLTHDQNRDETPKGASASAYANAGVTSNPSLPSSRLPRRARDFNPRRTISPANEKESIDEGGCLRCDRDRGRSGRGALACDLAAPAGGRSHRTRPSGGTCVNVGCTPRRRCWQRHRSRPWRAGPPPMGFGSRASASISPRSSTASGGSWSVSGRRRQSDSLRANLTFLEGTASFRDGGPSRWPRRAKPSDRDRAIDHHRHRLAPLGPDIEGLVRIPFLNSTSIMELETCPSDCSSSVADTWPSSSLRCSAALAAR